MVNRKLLALVLLALALVAGAALLDRFGEPEGPEDAVTFAQWAERGASVLVPTAELPAHALDPKAALEEYAVPAILEQPGQGLELELIDERTGGAAAGALVELLPNPSGRSTPYTYGMARDNYAPSAEERSLALRFVADSGGVVRLPVLSDQRFVMAEYNGAEGFTWLGSNRFAGPRGSEGRALRIVLRERRDLVLEVVDQLGEPVVDRRVFLSGRAHELLSWNETDAEGRLTLHHANTLLATVQDGREGDGAGIEISTRPSGSGKDAIELNLLELPAGTFTLQVDRAGIVEVRVLGRSGQELEGGSQRVVLKLDGDPEATRYSTARGSRQVVFDDLKEGDSFSVGLLMSWDGEPTEIVTGEVPGPSNPPLRLDLMAPFEYGCFARMRLVNVEGAPLKNQVVTIHKQLQFGGMTSWSGGSECRTDAEGRVKIELDPRLRDADRSYVILIAATAESDSGTPLFSNMPRFKGKLPGGPAELGDVVMSRGELLLAGRVVDKMGEPVVGAEIELKVPIIWPHSPQPGDHISVMPLPRQASSLTDAEGLFAVYGISRASEHYLQVHAPGYARDANLTFPVGTRDAQITVQRAGSIAGSVEGDSTDSRVWNSVYLRPQDEPKVARFAPANKGSTSGGGSDGWMMVHPSSLGLFGWDALTPGLYSVRFGEAFHPREGNLVKDVLVVAGEVTLDPRLQRGLTQGLGE